jgi:hypothetical protein
LLSCAGHERTTMHNKTSCTSIFMGFA